MKDTVQIELTREEAHTAVEALRRLAQSRLDADAYGGKRAKAASAARKIDDVVHEHDIEQQLNRGARRQ